MRLVGEVVSPALGNGSFGQTVLMTPAALDRVGGFQNENNSYLFINLAPGASMSALAAAIGDQFDILEPVTPSPVLGLGAIGGVDELLLGFIAVIGGAALVHGVRSATRQRRRDYAVMRALGARSRFVAFATAWHTAFILGAGALVGIPVGWILGRLVWSRTAIGMGVVVDYPSPVPMLATMVGATVIIGALIATGLGTVAASRSSTRLLRQE
jgi:ABC-type antimicrobial peptide transport system permease subunit